MGGTGAGAGTGTDTGSVKRGIVVDNGLIRMLVTGRNLKLVGDS